MNQLSAPSRLAREAAPIDKTDVDPAAGLLAAARRVAAGARANAAALDHDQAFPADDVRALLAAGLLWSPLPVSHGGAGLGTGEPELLAHVLMAIGTGSLPLGRLFEGHVNAAALVSRHGRPRQQELFAQAVRSGTLAAVWNTEAADGVRLVGAGSDRRLQGRKIFASGAGHVRLPLITARDEAGDLFMVLPHVDDPGRADLSSWTPHGMRASASGAVDFSGLAIGDDDILGGPDAFHAQPAFSTGAWRFAAVQTGGIAAVFDAARAHLVRQGRDAAPAQRARMAQAAAAVGTARGWVLEAARIAGNEAMPAELRIAHVHLTRGVVERAGLDVLELAQRSVGLAGFQRTHPLERLCRDLATYLRQPDPDGALHDAGATVLRCDRPILETWS